VEEEEPGYAGCYVGSRLVNSDQTVEEGSKQARSMKQQRARGEGTSETSRGSNTADHPCQRVKGAIEDFVTDPVQRGPKGGWDHSYISKSCRMPIVSSSSSSETKTISAHLMIYTVATFTTPDLFETSTRRSFLLAA
jgi:hypothetical protein